MPVRSNTRHTRLRRLRQRARMCLSPGTRSVLRTVPLSEFFGPSLSPGHSVILRPLLLHHRRRHHQHHHGPSPKYPYRMSRNKGGVSLSLPSQRSLQHKQSMHRCRIRFRFLLFFFYIYSSSSNHIKITYTLTLSRSHIFLIFHSNLTLCAMFLFLLAYLSATAHVVVWN